MIVWINYYGNLNGAQRDCTTQLSTGFTGWKVLLLNFLQMMMTITIIKPKKHLTLNNSQVP